MVKGAGRVTTRNQMKASHATLEAEREALMKRLSRLHPTLTKTPGYKTARALLGPKYMTAKLSARLKILQAANFLMSVLEMTPF
jgi:hypothetical protein